VNGRLRGGKGRVPATRKSLMTAVFSARSALGCLLLAGVAPAQPPADVSAALGELIASGNVPALAAAAVRRGTIVAVGASGVRTSGGTDPVTVDDRFHIGSCTKSMTATLAALLVKDGKLGWESTVAEVFADMEIHPDHRGTTLRQLLSNTGGCPAGVPPELWSRAWRNDGTESEQRIGFARAILGAPPDSPPGDRYTYSNTGFTIAGAMLERAGGGSFGEMLAERVFKPLGMRGAGFGAPASADHPGQPTGHRSVEGSAVPVARGPGSDNPPLITPAGRVHCSISDLARYAAAHLGNAPEVLDAAMLGQLHRPVSPAGDYALGWVVTERAWAGGTALHHSGTNTMFYAVMWLSPAKNFAVVAACNIGGSDGAKACDDAAALLIRRFAEESD